MPDSPDSDKVNLPGEPRDVIVHHDVTIPGPLMGNRAPSPPGWSAENRIPSSPGLLVENRMPSPPGWPTEARMPLPPGQLAEHGRSPPSGRLVEHRIPSPPGWPAEIRTPPSLGRFVEHRAVSSPSRLVEHRMPSPPGWIAENRVPPPSGRLVKHRRSPTPSRLIEHRTQSPQGRHVEYRVPSPPGGPMERPGWTAENRVPLFYRDREANVLPPRQDHFFGAGAHAESTHEFLRRGGMKDIPPYIGQAPQGGSFFAGAHHFTVNNPIMVSGDTPDMERKMMKLLQKKALVDAMYDSAARHDNAPRCHPDTRVSLRERIIAWLNNMDREEVLFWLYGPAGVGKSAIAQSLMEYCAEYGFLGAGLFLSRANKRDDANRVIPSLAYQLALAHPAYRQAITKLLAADSTILEKRLPLQFQQLIDKPADVFKLADNSNVPSHPILLLLDGLDECDTESAQRELIRLLADFTSRCKTRRLPFSCVITSRPEWQIVSTFNQLGSSPKVWREELSMDTPEARRDVERVLRAGFERIKNKHDDGFAGDTEWPARAKFRTIKLAASGNMLFASIVVDFIDDDDPNTRLELCLKFLQGKLASDEKNPSDPLAALYQGMLRSISPSLLPLTLRILYLHILNRNLHLTAQMSANFFHVDRPTFYECLRKLRSVIKVPLPSDAGRDRLEFSHTTFADYVKAAIQTGSLGLREVDAVEYIRTTCIRWYSTLKGNKDEVPLSDIIRWHGEGITDQILNVSGNLLFQLWDDLFHQGDLAKLQEELRHFVFKGLPRGLMLAQGSDDKSMRDLVENLINYQNANKSSAEDRAVRTTPVCPTDHKLLEKYRSLISQWGALLKGFDPAVADHDLKLHFVFHSADDPFDDLEAARHVSGIQWRPQLEYLLLGYGQNAVLVIVFPEDIEQGVYWKGVSERIRSTHAFASAPDTVNIEDALNRFYSQLSKCTRHPREDNKQALMINMGSLECTLVSFITHARHAPLARLEVITNILSVTRDPTEILHYLFQYTLHDIPFETQLVAQRLLAFLLSLRTDYIILSSDLEQMLHQDHATIGQVIQWLYPFVFSWFPGSDQSTGYLQIQLPRHDLQRNYINIEDNWKLFGYSPCFHLDEAAWKDVFFLWTQFGSSRLGTSRLLLPRSDVDEWKFLQYSSTALRSMNTSNGLGAAVIGLHNFPFCHSKLVENRSEPDTVSFFGGLKELACQLSQLVPVIGPVIRNQPIWEADHLLLRKWAKMGHDFEFAMLPFNGKIPWNTTFYVVSLHANTILPSTQQTYRIFFIGQAHNVCLIVMQPDSGHTWEDIDRCRDEDETSDKNETLDEGDDGEDVSGGGPWSWSMTPAGTSG